MGINYLMGRKSTSACTMCGELFILIAKDIEVSIIESV